MTAAICLITATTGCDSKQPAAPDETKSAPVAPVVDEAKAPEEKSETEEPVTWATVKAAIKDPKQKPAARVKLLESFIAANPDHPQRRRADLLLKKYSRMADYLAKSESSKQDDAKYAVERAESAKKILAGPLVDLVEPFLYRASSITYSDRKKPVPEGYTPVALKLDTFPDRTFDKPRYLGTGGVRITANAMLKERLPELHANLGCSKPDRCSFLAMNTLFNARAGGDLLSAPGKVDPARLGALLALSETITPETELLGTTAARVYSAYKFSISHYLRTYAVLEKTGTKRAKKAYAKALASDPGAMLTFYTTYSREQALFAMTGLTKELGDAPHVPVGFWMRRIDDGSAQRLFDAGMKLLSRFDPEEHAAISKLRK